MSMAVCADPDNDQSLQQRARVLAADLNLPWVDESGEQAGEYELLLTVTGQRLELRLRGDKGHAVYSNLCAMDVSSHAGARLKQPLAKALGIKRRADLPIRVIDATAGWGEDSWLMAGIGCEVLAVERDAVAVAMLRDGLDRAAQEWPEVAERVTLTQVDAYELLTNGGYEADVVYLDPMYPAEPRSGGRKTAERKALKALRQIVGDDADAPRLLEAAMGIAKKRVVVKRPARGISLGGEPVCSHKGKGVRYDVYSITKR
jgi:16S rRNA (guanine1516-N2)-methyltransferase